MKLRILIADDEPVARSRLRALVEELGHEVCAEAVDGTGAEQALARAQPDAALLDIEMPGSDGLSLARQLGTNHPGIAVVLVTAHMEHAVAAFDASVADYVLKPVHPERLRKALEKAALLRRQEHTQVPTIRLTIGRKDRRVPLNEIDCFTAEDGYVIARSAKLEGFVDTSLQQLEKHFNGLLIRVHRSCVAVRESVVGIEARSPAEHHILFRDGLKGIAISRRQLRTVRTILGGHI